MPAAFVPLKNGKKKPSLQFNEGLKLPLHLRVRMLAIASAEVQRLYEPLSSFCIRDCAVEAGDLNNYDKNLGKQKANVQVCVIGSEKQQQLEEKTKFSHNWALFHM